MTPDLSVGFVEALLIPLLIGFLVGVIARSAVKVGAAIAILVLLLIAAGILTPDQVLKPLLGLFNSGPDLVSEVQQFAGYLPYSSVTFLIGLAVGFFKS